MRETDVSSSSALIALSVIVLFAAIVAAVLIGERRKRAAWRQRLADLGWVPVAPVPPELSARIARLYQGSSDRRLRIEHVFERPLQEPSLNERSFTERSFAERSFTERSPIDGSPSGPRAVLFDVVDTTGGETSTTASGVLGVIAPSLELPDFLLAPRLPSGTTGALATTVLNVADRLIECAAGWTGLVRVGFEEIAEFDQRYIVFGRDEARVRQFLTPARLLGLGDAAAGIRLRAGGDMVTLERDPSLAHAAHRAAPSDALEALLADARRIYDWLHHA